MTKLFNNIENVEIVLPINYNQVSPVYRRLAREQYVENQNGICYYCKYSLNDLPPDHVMNKKINWKLFPEHFLRHPIHLHHNHETGMTIGAVHAHCNAVLFQHHGE